MASKNVLIKGSFDASQILASFRKIRDEAVKSNVSDKLLGGYDKELEKVEKLITLITAAQSRGLTDNLSIKEFSRLVGLLEKLFGILNVKAQGFADVANYKTESANLRKYTSQLEALIKKQDGLRKAAEDYIDANKKSLGINEKEAKLLKKAMADAEAYKKVVDDLVISKAKAAQQLATTESVKTKVGKEIVDNATGGNFEFGIAAKKGRDKSRENLAAKGLIDELKALAAALKEYQLTLRKTMEEGGTAEDAIKSFIEVMLKYKLEVKNADEVLQQFQLDMDKIVDTAMNTTDTKGGLDRNIKRLVSTNQSLSLAAAKLFNALPMQEYNNNLKELAAEKGKIALENDKLHKLNELAAADLRNLNEDAKKTNQGIVNGLNALAKEALKYVNILEQIKNGFESIGRGAKLILSVTTAWRSLRNVVKSTFNDVKALDKSFASIAMVTEYSVKDMWSQYDQYAEMANRLGQSTQSVVEASGLYYQQGLKTNEVLKLTEETMKLATLAGLDFKEATSQMTAALRAFHMDMSEGAHVTDVYAEVAAHAAVDVQGLSEAMSATAAIANSAGMSFENTTAMLATMVEATQEAPKNLGTAMKTILARFTELKTNVAGTADSEFDDLDYNKVDKALKSVGISIKDAAGLFRNMDEVLLELSSKWKGLDRNSLRYIATIAAGSRQQSRFIALMENYERTMELVDVALNSAGRSSLLFAKYLDTVEYRLNKIKNSWEQFRTSLLDSDAYKGALDAFGGFLNKLNDMSTGGLVTLAGTWLTLGRRAISGTINGISDIAGSIFAPLTKLKFLEKNPEYLNLTVELQDTAYEAAKVKGAKMGQAVGTIVSSSLTSAITMGLTADAPWKAAGLSMATSALPNIMAGFLAGGIYGALAGAVATLVTGAVSAVISSVILEAEKEDKKRVERQLEDIKKKAERAKENLEGSTSEAKSTENEIKGLEQILKEYDELKNKVVLTEEELRKYNDLVEDVKEKYPSLISYYDEETGKIKLNTKALKERVETLSELEKLLNLQVLADLLTSLNILQLQNLLNIKDTYLKKASATLGLDNKLQVELSKTFASYNGEEDINTLVNSLNNLAKETGAKLDDVKQIVEDFKSAYDNNTEKDEAFLDILTTVKKNNPELSDTEARKIALKTQKNINDEDKFKESEYKNLAKVFAELKYGSFDLENWKNIPSDIKKILEDYGLKDIYDKEIEGDNELITKLEEINAKALKTTEFSNQFGWIDSEKLLSKEKNKILGYLIEHPEAIDEILEAGAGSLIAEGAKKSFIKKTTSEAGNEKLSEKEQQQVEDIETLKKDYSGKTLEEYRQKYNKLSQELGEDAERLLAGLPDLKDFDELLKRLGMSTSKIYDDMSMESIEKLVGSLLDFFNNFEILGEDKVKLLYSEFVNIIENSGLKGQVADALFELSPESFKDMNYTQALEYILSIITDKMKSGHVGEDAGKAIAELLLKGFKSINIADLILSSSAAIEQALKNNFEQVTNYAQTYQDTLDLIFSLYKENGFIDIFNIEKVKQGIEDLGLAIDDIIGTDSLGNYIVNYDELIRQVETDKGLLEKITNEIVELKNQAIEQLNQKILMLKALKSENITQFNNLTLLQALTEEYKKLALLSADKEVRELAKTIKVSLDTDNLKLTPELERDIDLAIKDAEDLITAWNDLNIDEEVEKRLKSISNQVKKTGKEFKSNLLEEKDKAYKDWVDKTKAVTEALKNLAKAIETVAEKQKELKEVIEGTNWKSSIDGMYNYNTALDFLTKQTERAKKKLEKAGSIAEAKNNFRIYGQGLLDLKAQLTAQNQTYRTAYNNIGKVYNNDVAKLINSFEDSNKMKFNLADYLTFDEKTGTKINMNALQKAKMPEALKKWIESLGLKANEYLGKILDNEDKIELLNEEFLELLKKARDEYIDLQDLMMDVLREKYQQEIDDLLNKYDAMNEADNKYLESLQKNLDKQRKLRDLEKNWNDLTNKERKLSLMQRDTSGGNLADVKSLQEEIDDLRTLLLDDAVDLIIEKLSEFYELQKESRDAEIAYKLTLLDEANLMKEVTEALEKIHTSDDLVNWWKTNVTNIEGFSKEKLDKLTQDWNDLFKAKSNYVASIDKTMLDSITETNGHLKDVSDEATHIVETTSEGITQLAEKSLEEAGNEYKEAVKKAKEALKDAVDAVLKLKEALLAAIDAANESKKAFDDLAEKYKDLLAEKLKLNTTVVYKVGDRYLDQGLYSSYMSGNKGDPEKYGNKKGLAVTVSKDSEEYKSTLNNTPSISVFKDTERYIGKNSSGEIVVYSSKSSFNHYNPYKDTKETMKISENILHGVIWYDTKKKEWTLIKGFTGNETKNDAEKWIKENPAYYYDDRGIKVKKDYRAFAEGGLVNYTGPAWVDGSRSKPEAFLSSEDTRRIGEAARILADLPILSQPVKEQIPTTTIGDTTIQIDVHVDSIANDYDLDEAMNKVEQRIVNAAKYAGSNVILKKH